MLLSLAIATLPSIAGSNPASPVLVDLYVDASATCASGAGTLTNPYCTIGEAVAAAVNGDVIRIAAGTYVEIFDLAQDVALIGTDGREVTIIDGAQQGTVVTVQASATVTLDGVTVTGGNEGGLSNFGALTLLNSTVAGNIGSLPYSGSRITGGGITQEPGSGPLFVHRSAVNQNQVGGGILVEAGGAVTLLDSTISGNSAFSGGAIYAIAGGDIRILDSTISGNDAVYGGAVWVEGTNVEVLGTTISGNTGYLGTIGTFGFGGSANTSSTITNSTITGNSTTTGYSSTKGDVLWRGNGHLLIKDSTILSSGEIFPFAYSAPVTVSGSILSGSVSNTSVTSLGKNFVGAAPAGSGFTNGVMGDIVGTLVAPIDSLLGPLQDNGGPTLTHRPLFGSPVIDAGDQVTFEPLDQRGIARVAGDVDMGAVEGGFGDPIPICVSAPNSTGLVGLLAATGSPTAGDNDFTLTMSSLPVNQFGAFVASRTQGFTAGPGGSAGNLCLGGSIGRFFGPHQLGTSGPEGLISLRVPLTMIPQGSAFTAVQAGETWRFQGWHRDVVGGTATSNFSSGLAVTFL